MSSTNSGKKHEDTKATASTAGGGAAGALAGAGIGAAVGGPAGAAVGAGIGAVTGAAAGGAAGYAAHEAEFRRDFESSGASGKHTWESASPAYRYGYESFDRPEYRGKSYSEVSSHLKQNWTGAGDYTASEPYVRKAYEHRTTAHGSAGAASAASRTAEGGVIPVIEEELQVGKRQVETGGVRATTKVTETPVEADVHLHSEKVKVERRPVDRPVTDADAHAFREGTIELKETAEQAVVNKRARVVEEVVLSKEGSDTTHTVKDKVRKTDVDVQNVATPTKVTHETYESFQPHAAAHHQANYASKGSTLEEFTPAYRYGHTLATDSRYSTGEWSAVEPEARKHWEAKNEGTWEEFKDAVHHAWDKVRGKA